MIIITSEIAKKVIETVDAGLCSGLGKPIPGEMCVEAAVCYALGFPHGDEPFCVSRALRMLKMRLNDSCWSSNAARASGLRKLSILQLGSNGELDDIAFVQRLVPLAAAYAADAAANAATYAAAAAADLAVYYAANADTEAKANAADYAVLAEFANDV